MTQTQLRTSARPSYGPDALATARPARNGVRSTAALLRAMRPRQWTKNLLVLAAPTAAGSIDQPLVIGHSVEAFFIFVAASASTYLLNDVVDRRKDRLHPVKKKPTRGLRRAAGEPGSLGRCAPGYGRSSAPPALAFGAVSRRGRHRLPGRQRLLLARFEAGAPSRARLRGVRVRPAGGGRRGRGARADLPMVPHGRLLRLPARRRREAQRRAVRDERRGGARTGRPSPPTRQRSSEASGCWPCR